jgi:hypothetical protein
VRVVGRDINHIHPPERVFFLSNAYMPASAQTDYHMRMPMALEAGKSAARDLEITHMKAHMLATAPDQNLARGTAELTAAMRPELVRFQLYSVPSIAGAETPERG